MGQMKSFAYGALLFSIIFGVALVALLAVFAACEHEDANRMNRQNEQNAALMRKMPALLKSRNIADCIVEAGELHCESSVKGVKVTKVFR